MLQFLSWKRFLASSVPPFSNCHSSLRNTPAVTERKYVIAYLLPYLLKLRNLSTGWQGDKLKRIGDFSSYRDGTFFYLPATDGFASYCKLLCEHLNQPKAKLFIKIQQLFIKDLPSDKRILSND